MKKIIIFICVTLLLIIKCEIDHGIAPLPAKLGATVYFYGTPPENTEGIYLTVAPVFPPHAINELYHSPNSLPIDKDSVYVEMELPYGNYEAISLWWYNTETKSNFADILAIPLDHSNNSKPLAFSLTKEEPIFNIDLHAKWYIVDRDATIEGTIYFNGPFPTNTLATAVAAYQFKPEQDVHYLIWLKSIDFSIDKNPYHYRLPVHHGEINYVAVFWLSERATMTGFRTLGEYMDPNQPGELGRLKVKENDIITNIDIYADWGVVDNQ